MTWTSLRVPQEKIGCAKTWLGAQKQDLDAQKQDWMPRKRDSPTTECCCHGYFGNTGCGVFKPGIQN